MDNVERIQGGADGLSLRSKIGLLTAYGLLGTAGLVAVNWLVDAECRSFESSEVRAAANENREPRDPWRVCGAARWVIEHTP